jgi:hypothetical protein
MNKQEKALKLKKILADFNAKLALIGQKKLAIYNQAIETTNQKKAAQLREQIKGL